MSKSSKIIDSQRALYIKLGPSGAWEKECFKKGILRFGYKKTPIDAAVAGDWDTVLKIWKDERGDAGVAMRDLTQIQHFFTDGDDTLWITFSDGLLRWCRAKPGVKIHEDGNGTYRECVNGWHYQDTKDNTLSMDKLSGSLLRVQGFRGTICEVKEFEYLKRKLNGEMTPEVEAATQAENELVNKIVPLIQRLTWQDFELLVDLIFSGSGWRRVSAVGKTQKDIDIELISPMTGEYASVQIKSSASKQDLTYYLQRMEESELYKHSFFVWHTGDPGEAPDSSKANVVLLGPEKLAPMVLGAGLTPWLRGKSS